MKDVLADLPGYSLRRASAAMLSQLTEALEPLRLRITDASSLVLIGANTGITPSELGKLMAIQRSNMVPLIAKLEDRGLVSREALDGRSFGLRLTENGVSVAAKVEDIMKSHEDRLLARIPPEHRDQLAPALKALWED